MSTLQLNDVPPPPSFAGEAHTGIEPTIMVRPVAGGSGASTPRAARSPPPPGGDEGGATPNEFDAPRAPTSAFGGPGAGEPIRTFSRDLWSCFDAVSAQLDQDPPLLKDVAAYFKTMAEIERTYASEVNKASGAFLKRMSTKHSASALSFSSLSGITAFTQTMMREAMAHNELAHALESDVVRGFEDTAAKSGVAVKTYGTDGRNLQREERDQLSAHARARTAFHKIAEEHEASEAALADARAKGAKDLDKTEKKHAKLVQSLEQACDEYSAEVATTNAFVERLHSSRMTSVLDALQATFDEVRATSKALLTTANNIAVSALNSLAALRTELAHSLAALDPVRECQAFIRANLPPTTRAETFVFIEHTESAETTRRRRLEHVPTPRGIRLSFSPTQLFAIPLHRALERQVMTAPSLNCPRFLIQLFDWVLGLGGLQTEGVFRLPGNRLVVESARHALDDGANSPPTNVHVASSLLKLWLKELAAPLVSPQLYDRAVRAAAAESVDEIRAVVDLMPVVSAAVLLELARFLAKFCEPRVTAVTRMSPENVATCFTSIVLKSPSADLAARVKHLDHEIAFVRLTIQAHAAIDSRRLLQ